MSAVATTPVTGACVGEPPEQLGVDTLSYKEGWCRFVEQHRPDPPPPLTIAELKRLGEDARREHDRRRRHWHANIGPVRTPQLAALHEDLWDIVDSNLQDCDKAKGAVALDAFPGLGKTTSVLTFAKEFHRREIAELGTHTRAGHPRLPVCRVGLTGNTGMRDFNRAMLDFYNHPGVSRGTAAEFARRALQSVLHCETRLLVIDDLHFLRTRSVSATEVSNHFKYIANEFPVTLIFIGVGLASRGLFSEGSSFHDAVLAQTGRRTTRLGMEPFDITTGTGRRQWRQLLLAVERHLVLADSWPGMLAEDLSDYLFTRSTGHIGSLFNLINRGCQRAIRTGHECLDQDLLDRVKNDEASERSRAELDAAMASGKLTTRTSRRGQ
jgi:hypothetical protein